MNYTNLTFDEERALYAVSDSVIENCRIIGTQPFCYCRNLVLQNCTMENCDLAFERSTVQASVIGNIDSVKNPLEGKIEADCIKEIIMEESVVDASKTKIICRDCPRQCA